MPQPAPSERRREPRQPRAFAFWWRPAGTTQRHSAWMVDQSVSGAAFLVDAACVPAVGAELELIEMQICDLLVREDAAPLPPRARVLRIDPEGGITRRVAVRLDTQPDVALSHAPHRLATATRTAHVRPGPPPPIPLPPLGAVPAAAGAQRLR